MAATALSAVCDAPTADRFFLGESGEMAWRIAAHDWGSTALGSPDAWPQGLKMSIRLMLASRHPILIWWGPDHIQFYNDAYRETLCAARHPSALGASGGDCWAEVWDIVGPQIDLVMRGDGATWHEDMLVPVTRHGSLQQVWWTYGFSPIEQDDGIGGVLAIVQDVTRGRLASEAMAEANTRLADKAGRLHDLFRQAPGFVASVTGPNHIVEFTNLAFERLTGTADLVGRPVRHALPELAGQGFIHLLDQVYATGAAHAGAGVPMRIRGPGGAETTIYVDFVYQPVRGSDGVVSGIIVEGCDVTARVLGQERKDLLAREMSHRVKNVLATVQSLALLTGRSAKTVADYQAAFSGRIGAMAKTQDLFLRRRVEAVEVRKVIEAELAPYIGGGANVVVECADMAVGPDAAVDLSLLVHEMLTNAAKYGGLSSPGGSLSVIGEREGEFARLAWRETSTVQAAPSTRKGFGTVLIDRLARQLGGCAILDFRPAGLDASITFQVDPHGEASTSAQPSIH